MKLGYFLVSCLLAFIGGHMLNYSIVFLGVEWFESTSISGLGFALAFGPPILLGWVAGVFCDKYAPRIVILGAQNAYLLAAFILLYFALNDSEYRLIGYLTAGFCLGIAWSFVAPARFASVRFYASRGQLVSATILLNVMVMIGFGIAPILVKSIVYYYGWPNTLLFSALLILLSSLLLLLLPYRFDGCKNQTVRVMLSETLLAIRKSNSLQTYLILAACVYLLMGPIQILLPKYAATTLQLTPVHQGWYLSLVAIALIIGGIFALKLKPWVINFKALSVLVFTAAIGFAAIGVLRPIVLSAAVLSFSAILGGTAVSLIVSGIQQSSDDHSRGRVMSAYTILSQVIPAISGLVAGVLAQHVDLSIGFLFSTVLVAALLYALKRQPPHALVRNNEDN